MQRKQKKRPVRQIDEDDEVFQSDIEELQVDSQSQKVQMNFGDLEPDINEIRPNQQVNQHQVQETNSRFFSIEEVGDLIKSRRNLIYMLRLSGLFIRFLLATRQDVHIEISQRCFSKTKIAHESLRDHRHSRNPTHSRN